MGGRGRQGARAACPGLTFSHPSTPMPLLLTAPASTRRHPNTAPAPRPRAPPPGVGGATPLADGYLPEVYKMVREAGGICIADEVGVL
jgi:hypothetical protein